MNTSTNLKIGIIQNSPLTADLSNNLRQIVQGYRECLDHGANLIVAPACALCGPNPGALLQRSSFIHQIQSALKALSMEIGEVPLLLAAFTPGFQDEDGEEPQDPYVDDGISDLAPEYNRIMLVPHLLESGQVTELVDCDLFELDGVHIYTDVQDVAALPVDTELDLIIHMPTLPWHATGAPEEEDLRQWEAQTNHVPVISVYPACTGDGDIYAGGSGAYSADGATLARLPFFESANKVINLAGKTRAKALPEPRELLFLAIERGIRDTVKANGYTGVCINLDQPNADVLAAICTEALGRSNVVGITTTGQDYIAKTLNITCHKPNTSALLSAADDILCDANADAFRARLLHTLSYSIAENHGLMYLSSLSRRDFMLGEFTLYGESCGLLAPLGNLYEMDLHLLRNYLAESYTSLFGPIKSPEVPETDSIIHELADRNIGASDLLNEHTSLFRENEVRMIQRKIIASALKRTQMPMVLHVDRPQERQTPPVSHRLND